MRQTGVDPVGHPADQRQPVISDRLGGKQRMINAPFLDPHHHQYRELLLHHPLGERSQVVHQAAPAAGAFDHHMLDLPAKPLQTI